MLPSDFLLTPSETKRLEDALQAAWAVPFIEDIGDFTWEAIFHYVKGLGIADPLTAWSQQRSRRNTTKIGLNNIPPTLSETVAKGKTKQLFDAIDPITRIGWSIKALQLSNLKVGTRFEFIIQRASIFRTELQLGYPERLSIKSHPDTIGGVLIQYWNDKVIKDMQRQSVSEGRLAILLKNLNRTEYVYIERPIPIFNADDFVWSWSNENNIGLQ
jgi:hypothetical protein